MGYPCTGTLLDIECCHLVKVDMISLRLADKALLRD